MSCRRTGNDRVELLANLRHASMETYRALRVLRADRGGSSWRVLIDTDAGVFHTKLRGAAQAPASLAAEIIVGGLADALGLSVPARVLIDIPSDVPVDDPHQELGELLYRSVGRNLGFQYMSDVRSFDPIDVPRVDRELASKIVWVDGLVQNPDRTVKNPNLLWSHGALWLIDHGASLGFQHDWPRVTEQSPRLNGWQVGGHVLRSRATQLHVVDAALASRLHRGELESGLDAVPDDFLSEDGGEATRRRRAAYVAFLWKRLQGPRPFMPAARPAAGYHPRAAGGARCHREAPRLKHGVSRHENPVVTADPVR